MGLFPVKAMFPFKSCLNWPSGMHKKNLLHGNVLRDLIAVRIQRLHYSSNEKLINRIAHNMSDDLKKHQQAHLDLERIFGKEAAVFTPKAYLT